MNDLSGRDGSFGGIGKFDDPKDSAEQQIRHGFGVHRPVTVR
jgi:hypothetical protein